MIFKNLVFLLVPLTIAATLLNTPLFGVPSLSAFFGYTILAGATGVTVFFKSISVWHRQPVYLPFNILVFLTLGLYALIQGYVTKNIGLVHYYWIGSALFLSSIHILVSFFSQKCKGDQPALKNVFQFHVFLWITILVLFESFVVLFQFFGIIQTKGNFFPCTGTWGNPNVSAMFLAMSLVSLFYVKNHTPDKRIKSFSQIGLFIVLCAILFLQSRSAYLASIVLLSYEYWSVVKKYLAKHIKWSLSGFAFVVTVLIGIIIIGSALLSKKASSNSRIQIWTNSIDLIKQKPITGHGFGLFEKVYNTYSANKKLPINDHINNAYNDFIELGVEGGVPAVMLWILFLYLTWIRSHKVANEGFSLSPVLTAFIIIQLTNFGFQAIPAYILFLVYVGVSVPSPGVVKEMRHREVKYAGGNRLGFGIIICSLVISTAFLLKIVDTAYAFNKNSTISKLSTVAERDLAYKSLNDKLQGYAIYHENYGNLWMGTRRYELALSQYKLALKKSRSADLLIKCGYCYQYLGFYDSSEVYYTTVANMQPHKYAPQLALLKLYEVKKDTMAVLKKAKEIVSMKIKVKNKKVFEIKAFAQSVLNNYSPEY